MLIEWCGKGNVQPLVWIGDNALTIRFFPQPRYCGTRTREIGDPSAVATLRYGNYKPYIGPVLEAIPEFDQPDQDVDWLGGLRKLKEAVPPLVWEQFMAELIEVPITVDDVDDVPEPTPPDRIEVETSAVSTGAAELPDRPVNPPRLVQKRKPGRPKTRG